MLLHRSYEQSVHPSARPGPSLPAVGARPAPAIFETNPLPQRISPPLLLVIDLPKCYNGSKIKIARCAHGLYHLGYYRCYRYPVAVEKARKVRYICLRSLFRVRVCLLRGSLPADAALLTTVETRSRPPEGSRLLICLIKSYVRLHSQSTAGSRLQSRQPTYSRG